MQTVILGWQMYVLSGSAYLLGFVGLAEAVPALGLALFAGYYVDHRKPLPIYFGILFLSFFSACQMFLAEGEDNGLSLHLKIGALFLSSICTGIARAFAHPTIYTLVPGIVPRDKLPKAAAISASTMQVARISGPAAGGLLFGVIGISNTAALVAGALVLSMIAAYTITLSPPAAENLTSTEAFKDRLMAGAKYVFRHPILFPALTLDMVSVFMGGVTALLPIYASDILMVGANGMGLLRSAPAVGAAVVGMLLIFLPLKKNAGRFLLLAVAGFGCSILVFAFSTNFILSLIALAFSGAFDSVSVVVRSSAIQLCSPDGLRGRISSVNSMFIGSSNELGEFESGMLAGMFGAVSAACIGGIACLMTVTYMTLYFPHLRRLDISTLKQDNSD